MFNAITQGTELKSTSRPGETKMEFELYNQKNAPIDSLPLLEKSVKDFGMVPNLHAVLAESPATLEAANQ